MAHFWFLHSLPCVSQQFQHLYINPNNVIQMNELYVLNRLDKDSQDCMAFLVKRETDNGTRETTTLLLLDTIIWGKGQFVQKNFGVSKERDCDDHESSQTSFLLISCCLLYSSWLCTAQCKKGLLMDAFSYSLSLPCDVVAFLGLKVNSCHSLLQKGVKNWSESLLACILDTTTVKNSNTLYM